MAGLVPDVGELLRRVEAQVQREPARVWHAPRGRRRAPISGNSSYKMRLATISFITSDVPPPIDRMRLSR